MVPVDAVISELKALYNFPHVHFLLPEYGVRINMSTKKALTTQSKLSRIIQFAPDIKKFYFVDAKHRSAEYEKFMRELTLFTVSGKNLHDDAPDACAMLVDFITGGIRWLQWQIDRFDCAYLKSHENGHRFILKSHFAA